MSDFAHQFGISPGLVTRYLRTRGWDLTRLQNGMNMLSKDEGDFEIFLSQGREGRNHKEEVYFALRTISDYYGKDISEVCRSVSSHLSDRISSRIPDEYVRNDSIEFKVAATYISGMKTLLSSSATTEITDNRSFRRTLKEAIQYSETCRFAHTFRGSFGFVIESPVGVNDTPPLDGFDEDVPLERRVVERLVHGFSSIEEASIFEDPSLITGKTSGLSANMCDALADLLEDMDVSNIKFEVDFSSEWRRKETLEQGRFFQFAQSDVEIIREGARALKIDEVPQKEAIFGKVRRVGTDGNPSDLLDDGARREIEINWISDDDKLIHIKILVSPEDYLKALDAHKNSKVIAVTGLLSATGKTRWLTEHGGLSIVGP